MRHIHFRENLWWGVGMSIIALMSDFGTRDHYVAAMKGVILQINPKVTLVDVTHDIAPHDILHGAFVLRQTLPYYPERTIFVAVVDPGVGTSRRIVVAQYSTRLVVAPDNGLLTLLHRNAELQAIRTVENRQFFNNGVSNTFHGRDIMAPVAAHLSRGVPLEHLGPPADHMEILDLPRPTRRSDGTIDGQVTFIDHFGNLVTNISSVDLSASMINRRHLEVTVGAYHVGPIRSTYGEVNRGEPLALFDSSHMLEIAVNQGNAATALGVERGAVVHVG